MQKNFSNYELKGKYLFKYLKSKGILIAFAKNVENFYFLQLSCEDLLKILIKKGINGSFIWSSTKEGHKFWEDVYNESERLWYSK
jgi:hypothetical protein